MTTMVVQGSHLMVRLLRAMLRQPYYLAVSLTQPIIWLLLFGQLFKNVTEIPGFATSSYIDFLTPGVVVMTAMYSNGWSGMNYVVDIERGVLDRFLISPVRRESLIGGQLAYNAVLTLVQSFIIIALGLIAGARFHGGPLVMALFIVAVLLLGMAFSSFSDAMGLLLRQEASVVAVVNFVVLPLSFLSTVFMPAGLLPHWIRVVARFNPVNWAVEVGRQTLTGNVDWTLVGSHLGYLAALALALAWLATRAFRSYQRSV
ncbi:MAG: ABC transporter permease [Dehalococcoidia bacterium]|jgi:ABC-2 type transport system permease protein